MYLFDITESAKLQEEPLEEGIHDPNIFKAIFMAGPPGAGKNTVISELGLNSKGFKLLDTDKTLYYIKKAKNDLAGFQQPSDADREVSLRRTMSTQTVLQRNMLGLLINTTGRDSDKLMETNRALKSAGYDTFMLFVDTEYDVAFHRIKYREKNATDPWDRRPVDKPYFDQAFDNSKQNLEFYALMFGHQFSLVTNNVLLDKHINEDGEEIDPHQEFRKTLKVAERKVTRFLQKPLTPAAQTIVNQFSKRT